MSRLTSCSLLATLLALAIAATPVAHAEGTPAATALDAAEIVQQVVARCSPWLLQPGPKLKSLKYAYHLNGKERIVELAPSAKPVRRAFWQGATLSLGLHALAESPDDFTATAELVTGAADHPAPFIRLTVRPKAEGGAIRPEAGNGIEGSWHGYYIHGSAEMQLDLDPQTLLPQRELHRHSRYAFRDWQEVSAGAWAPRLVIASREGYDYWMNFAWQGDAVWLLTHADMHHDGLVQPVARVSDVLVNDEAVTVALSAEQQRIDAARRVVREMLDRNAAWLAPRPIFDTLQYSFHIENQDVTETCVVRRDGFALFELTGDGQGKLGDQLGNRKIVAPDDSYATAGRGDMRANVRDSAPNGRGPNYPRQLRRYALTGGQFDLPLFELPRLLDDAMVDIADGEWQGVPCHVATIIVPSRQAYLGCGVMLGFTSWSYVHHHYPEYETIYIDKNRLVPLHISSVESRDGRKFEIDFQDYRPIAGERGQLAPLRIDLASPEYFACRYDFQLVEGKQWLLRSVESWFKPNEKSRGVVTDVRVDEPSAAADAALQQVAAFQDVFAEPVPPAAETAATQSVETLPFALGRPQAIGAGQLLFTLDAKRQLVARATAANGTAASSSDLFTILLLDQQNRLVQAGSSQFIGASGQRIAEINFGESYALGKVARYAVAGLGDVAATAGAESRPLRLFPVAAGAEATRTRAIADSSGKTRVVDAALRQNAAEQPVAKLRIVSRDGPQRFEVDAAVALFNKSGELVAAAAKADAITVNSDLYESAWELPLPSSVNVADVASIAVGVASGHTLSAPVGSLWASMMDLPAPFPVDVLLAAENAGCWPAGLDALHLELRGSQLLGLLGSEHDWRKSQDRREPPTKLLAPHVGSLLKIVDASPRPTTLSAAIRLLGFAEDPRAVEPVRRHAADADPSVRDAAAIALAMLKQDESLAAIDEILSRPTLDAQGQPLREGYHLRQDALISLATLRSGASIPLAKKWLQTFVDGSEVVMSERGGSHLNHSGYSAQHLAKLLGRVQDERYLPILTATLQRAQQRNPDDPPAAEELLAAILSYAPESRPFVETLVRAGNPQSIHAVAEARDDFYIDAVAAALPASDDLGVWRSAISYLENYETTKSLAALRQAFLRGIPTGEGREAVQLDLAAVLASRGDSRGLPLAWAVLVELAAPGEPPHDAKAKWQWERQVERRQENALRVFELAAADEIAALLIEHAPSAEAAAQLATLQVIKQAHAIPAVMRPHLERWAADESNAAVSQSAERLLKRE